MLGATVVCRETLTSWVDDDAGPAGERLACRSEVEYDEGRRDHVEDPGQAAEVAARADDEEGDEADEDRRGEEERPVKDALGPDGDLAGDMAEREEPEKRRETRRPAFAGSLKATRNARNRNGGAGEGHGERPGQLSQGDGDALDVVGVEGEDGEERKEEGVDGRSLFHAPARSSP